MKPYCSKDAIRGYDSASSFSPKESRLAGDPTMTDSNHDGESERRPTNLGIDSTEDARRFRGSHKIDTDEADQVAETKEKVPIELPTAFTLWDV
jgi:hypothetical protein